VVNRGFVGGVVGAGLMLAAGTAWGQAVVGEPTNAAKTFSTNCAMCHNSPRGLAKDDRSLSGFLLQHYTTGPQMSAAMAAYLASAGRGAPPKEGREKGQREAAPRDPTSREAAAPREGREKSQRDAAPREPAPREARTGEDGVEKQTPAKRTEPRKQQSAKATPEPPKRRQHDSAPAVDAVRPAEPEKPTVEAAKPIEAPDSKPAEGAPGESKPAESIRLDAPRQEAAAPAPVPAPAPAPSAAPQPREAAPAAEAAPAQVPATASVPAKADQPSFSSPLP
jgi:hypothetical protein